MAIKKLVQCPSCKFANRFGEARCLICKAPLPQELPQGQRRPRRPPPPRDRMTRRQPGRPDAKRPDARRPDSKRPDGKRPDSARPDSARPDGRRPDSARPDAKRRRARPGMDTVQGGSRRPPQPDRPGKPTTKALGRLKDASKTIAWICCDPLPPIPLGPTTTLIIGRSDDADLVLPHREVSRHHAVIKVRGKRLISFDDEGSSNGSFLNGRRVSSSVLKVGDVITLGPYEIEIVSNEKMAARSEREDDSDTKSFELTSVARVAPQAAMSGQLHEVPLAEVLQGIEFNKKTGTLSVLSGRKRGKVAVGQGLPIYANLGGLKDEEAVLAMLQFNEGRFIFSGEVEPGEQRMSITLTALLLEHSRRIDEASDMGFSGNGSEPVEASLGGSVGDVPPEVEETYVGMNVDELLAQAPGAATAEPHEGPPDESSLGWLDGA